MEIYLLEYCKEIDYESFTIEDYNLIGIYLSENDARNVKNKISENSNINEEDLYVSSTKVGKLQWEGGFISV